ncbi:Blp family class II bacteriocin [Streptococcus fryi]
MNTKIIEKNTNLTSDDLSLIVGGVSACDWVVGGSGVVLSGLYGFAIGAAFGNVPGAIAGMAVGMGWIPVSAACP